MKTKEKYQACLDRAYQFAPFRVREIIDLKHFQDLDTPHRCQVCANRHLRYLCKCADRYSNTWYIGRNCHTKLEERYEEEKRK